MSSQGTPLVGDQPGFEVDNATGSAIPRYSLVQFSTSTAALKVGLYSTSNPTKVCGVCFRAWPYTFQLWDTADNRSTNISNYDTTKNPSNRITVKQTGYTWILVTIPANGATVDVVPGDWLMPSTQMDGGVVPYASPASTVNSTYDEARSWADMNTVGAQRAKVVARAYSLIHVPSTTKGWENRPGIGSGTVTTSLLRSTTAVVHGYVFARLNI